MIQIWIASLALALIGAGVQSWRLDALQDEVAAAKATQTENALLRERGARAQQALLNDGARKANDAYLAQAKQARAAAADTDAAYRGMLDALADAAGGTGEDPVAACRVAGERVRVLAGLLEAGSGLVREGAERVGRLDAKLTGLQEHTKVGQVPLSR